MPLSSVSGSAKAADVSPFSIRKCMPAWMITAVFMLSNSPTPLYVYWQDQMGFSSGMLTVIFSFYIAGLLGALLVAGQLSDYYGRKPVLLPGLFAALVACGLFAHADSIGMLAIGRLLTGVAVGVIVSAGMAAVVETGLSQYKRQATLLASVAMVLGAGLGPLLAGGLVQVLRLPVVPIFVIEAMILLSAITVAVYLPPRQTSVTGTFRLRLPHVPFANRQQVFCGIATFGPGITATSFVLALGPSILTRLLDMHSALLGGGMVCAMFFTAAGVQFVARQWPVTHIFVASTIATVLAMAGLVLAIYFSQVTALIVAALLAGAAQGLGQLGGLTLIGLHVPDSHRAQSNAVLNIGGYIPAGLLPVAAGYLIDSVGLASGATLFALLLALVALISGAWAACRVSI